MQYNMMHFKMIKYDRIVVNTFIIPLFLPDSILATGCRNEFLASIGGRKRCKLKWTQCNDLDKNLFR